jgi:hypothetical protein
MMQRQSWVFAVGMVLLAATGARAQVVGGVMSVTQSHMS